MEFNRTNRGFGKIDFTDHYNQNCSLQESSLATEAAIWLGTTENRMHLTVDMVRDLLPYLHSFVNTGQIADKDGIVVSTNAIVNDFAEELIALISNVDNANPLFADIRRLAADPKWSRPIVESDLGENVGKFLDLSTAHLSPAAMAWLTEAGWMNECSNRLNISKGAAISTLGTTMCGWFTHVPHGDLDKETGDTPAGVPAELEAVFAYARSRDLAYILFDADGPECADLPMWEDGGVLETPATEKGGVQIGSIHVSLKADFGTKPEPSLETAFMLPEPPSFGGVYPNGKPMYAADGTMLDEKGNRSIFDDVDEGGEVEPIPSGVYFGVEGNNFYSQSTGWGMGTEFWQRWRKRASEFPQSREQCPPAHPDDATIADELDESEAKFSGNVVGAILSPDKRDAILKAANDLIAEIDKAFTMKLAGGPKPGSAVPIFSRCHALREALKALGE